MFLDNKFDYISASIERYVDLNGGGAFKKVGNELVKQIEDKGSAFDILLEQAVKVNITDHFHEMYRIKRADIAPIITCPWTLAWFEASVPRELIELTNVRNVGYLVTKQMDNMVHKVYIIVRSIEKGEEITNIFGQAEFKTNEEGEPEIDNTGAFSFGLALNKKDLCIDDKATEEIFMSMFSNFLRVLLSAVGLLNCKNITLKDNYPPPKLNKKRIKTGKRPLSEHKTIVIERMNKSKSKSSGHTDTKQRLHKRRGSWGDYRKGNGLFGKLHGIYYRSECFAGSEDLGVITHDYKI